MGLAGFVGFGYDKQLKLLNLILVDGDGTVLDKLTINSKAASDCARLVLDTEMGGRRALSDALDDGFARAVDLIAGVSGRVIVTGMGKSGHIANKIAATLASTGTPAHYLHPGEVSHGNLGMITINDALIALSNSGETSVLTDIMACAKLKCIPLISMTGKANSALSSAADVPLVCRKAPKPVRSAWRR